LYSNVVIGTLAFDGRFRRRLKTELFTRS